VTLNRDSGGECLDEPFPNNLSEQCHKHGPRKNVAMLPEEVEHLAAEVLKLREALKMLYDLLEEYAPLWYTEEVRDKVQAALRSRRVT
jgi:hypothetical protein